MGVTVPVSLIIIGLVFLAIFLVCIRKICQDKSTQKPSLSKGYLSYLIRRPVAPVEIPLTAPPPQYLPIPFCDIHPHYIETSKNIKKKNNFMSFSSSQMSQIVNKINDLQQKEIIFEADQNNLKACNSWLNNPVITEDNEFFIDIRNLNVATVRTANTKFVDLKYIIEKLRTASVFSVFNLNSVHSQIKLSETTRFKTAFESPTTKKVYYFNTMP